MFITNKTQQKKEMNTIKIAAIVTFIVIMLVGYNSKAQTKSTTPTNLYAITGNGLKDTSWLFGTYHLINDSYINEVPYINTVFNKSKGGSGRNCNGFF
ncbi:MAG: hypothetical protein NTZ59_01765 [Bacteroidetes bacterium]|nr:hypothetical protein [Bacteroidota bacterium]